MRKTLAFGVFVFGVVLAACGGGGKSGVIPTGPTNPAPVQTPSNAKHTMATVVLHIPAPSQQAHTKRPFYISSSTQSVGILVAPAGSATPSPLPTAQVFPVTTPSPCSTAAAGGEICTFTVVAPIGNDFFLVSTYATAGPNASTLPLSIAEGEATVSLNPNPSASPLSFSLNAIVASVTISVPSPDPSNTPNTQVFTAGVPASPVPLAISAKDSNNNTILSDPTTLLANAVVIQFSPPPNAANAGGLQLGLTTQCGGSNATSGVGVAISCAADFNNVTLSYTGNVSADANNHIIDNVSIVPVAAFLSSPAPAHAVLQSNVVSYPIPSPFSATGGIQSGLLQLLSNGSVAYLAYNSSGAWGVGTFAPATGTLTAPTVYTGATPVSPYTFAITSDLSSVWTTDSLSGQLFCWTGIAALTGANPSSIVQASSVNGVLNVVGLTLDAQGNLWYVGFDSTSQQFAGHFPAGSNCTTGGTPPIAQVKLTSDTSDYSNYLGSFQNGIAYNSQNNGVYVATTLSAGSVLGRTATLAGANNDGGVGVSNNATVYAAFSNNASSADIESLASPYSGPFATLATLVPTTPIGGNSAFPTSVSVFSSSTGAADRAIYAESDFYALGYVEGIQSTPVAGLIGLPNATRVFQTAFTKDGGPLILYEDNNNNLYLARALPTTTWSVPVSSLFEGCYGGIVSVDQRGTSSGPFTFTVNGTGANSYPLPGSNSAILVSGSNFTGSITVTDASGRARTYPLAVNGSAC